MENKPMTVDDMECHLAALDTHIEDLVASRDCFKNKLKLSKPHIPLPGIDFDPSMTSTARENPMTVENIMNILKEFPKDMEVVVTDPRAFENYDLCMDIVNVRFDPFTPNVVGGRDSARPCVRIVTKGSYND